MINYGDYFEPPVEVDDEYDYWFQEHYDEAIKVLHDYGILDIKAIIALTVNRLEEEQPAWDIFNDLKLNKFHCYALLDMYREFKDEFSLPEPEYYKEENYED